MSRGSPSTTPSSMRPAHAIPEAMQDHGVSFRALVAGVLWVLGYPDQAVQRSQEALTMAHALAHPFILERRCA